jgi:membrane fusion protein (multidrug efflux system)
MTLFPLKRIAAGSIISISVVLMLSACKQQNMEVTTTIEVPVGVIEVGTSSIEEFVSTNGSVYPLKEVTLTSEIAGKYHLQINPATGKPYALGDRVSQDAALILIEDEEYSNGLRIKSREVDLEISKLEYEKQQSLYEKGGATLRELKNAEINLINTEYEMESSRINLAKMTLQSPFSGVIADLPYFTNGTRIAAGTEMARVIDFGKLYLEANLPEKYYASIERGYRVYVTSYTSASDTLAGIITQISPSIDAESRTFRCFVVVDNRDGILLPGMFVKADLVVNSSENTIVIPRDIIISRNRNQIVYVVDKGVASERVIITGLQNDKEIEVKMGLLKGESVVNTGFETLRDQSRVKILR